MGWVTAIAVYIVVWWISLFLVLPWGVTPAQNQVIGPMPGAPAKPRIKEKFMATTILAAVIWLIIYILVRSDIISFHAMATQMMREDGLQ